MNENAEQGAAPAEGQGAPVPEAPDAPEVKTETYELEVATADQELIDALADAIREDEEESGDEEGGDLIHPPEIERLGGALADAEAAILAMREEGVITDLALADVSRALSSFAASVGITPDGIDLLHREAILIDALGATSTGEKVHVVHNKSNTAIQLRIGKRKVPEEQAMATLSSLVKVGQVQLEELTLSFSEGDGDGDGDLTFTAMGEASCARLMGSARSMPIGWIHRDLDSLCGEIESSLEFARELVDSSLLIRSGGVRCVRLSGAEVTGLQRWVFVDGRIYSITWEGGGDSAARERVRRLTAIEMLNEMHGFRREGWKDFKTLANLDAMVSMRLDAHRAESGELKASAKAVPHEVDTSIMYESSIDGPGSVRHISNLWNLVRDHMTAAFDDHVQAPLELLSSLKDRIDLALIESVEKVRGTVRNELVTRTLEQFESAEPDPEEIEDDPDGEEPEFGGEGDDGGPVSLSSADGLAMLESLRGELGGGIEDAPPSKDDSGAGRNAVGNRHRRTSTRGGHLSGTTRRSRA